VQKLFYFWDKTSLKSLQNVLLKNVQSNFLIVIFFQICDFASAASGGPSFITPLLSPPSQVCRHGLILGLSPRPLLPWAYFRHINRYLMHKIFSWFPRLRLRRRRRRHYVLEILPAAVQPFLLMNVEISCCHPIVILATACLRRLIHSGQLTDY
jgi:hypothetical protein